MQTQSLYERLGGTAGIEALVDDIVAAHMQNPVINARFRPYLEAPEKLTVTKGHLCAFLEAGCGGRNAYTGRSMIDTHRGMNISEAEYIAVLDDILKTLETHGVDAGTRNEILAIAYGLKGEILHV
jgi:hemoglobin